MLAVLSLAMMGWAWLFNSAWDRTELLLAGRAASDRPHRLRALHAVGHEASAAVVTWPLIVASTPLGWGGALAADLGLSLAYAVYGCFFHLGFDRPRPVRFEAEVVVGSRGPGKRSGSARRRQRQTRERSRRSAIVAAWMSRSSSPT